MAALAFGGVQSLTITAGSSVVITGTAAVQFTAGANAGQIQAVSGLTTLGPYSVNTTAIVANTVTPGAIDINFVAPNRQVIAQLNGSIATPLSNLTSSTGAAFPSFSSITIPGCRIPDHGLLRVIAKSKRSGANATANLEVYLGTAGTVADSLLGRVAFAATDQQVAFMDATAMFGTSFTSFLANGIAQQQNTAGGGTFIDKSTNVNRAVPMFVTFGIGASNALDSFALTSIQVSIEAA